MRGVPLTFAFAAALGCEGRRYGPDDNPTVVRDTTGFEFNWPCDDGGCQVTQIEITRPP